jgi:hypothetical protein
MDLKIERLGKGEQIAAGSAIALLACMFLSWFNFGYDASNAWESLHYIGPLLAIAIAATLGIAFAKASSRSTGDIPDGMVIFILGGFSALLVLYRLIDPISAPTFEGGSTSASIEAGAFLGLFAAAGIAAGGYIATDGMAIDRLKALLPSAGPGTGGPRDAAGTDPNRDPGPTRLASHPGISARRRDTGAPIAPSVRTSCTRERRRGESLGLLRELRRRNPSQGPLLRQVRTRTGPRPGPRGLISSDFSRKTYPLTEEKIASRASGAAVIPGSSREGCASG